MIKFLEKIVAQKILSVLPGGSEVYLRLQDRVTRSTVPTMQKVRQKMDVGYSYLRLLKEFSNEELVSRGVHVDYGAGWHLTIPLLFWQVVSCKATTEIDDAAAGAREQLVVEQIPGVVAKRFFVQCRRILPFPVVQAFRKGRGHGRI